MPDYVRVFDKLAEPERAASPALRRTQESIDFKNHLLDDVLQRIFTQIKNPLNSYFACLEKIIKEDKRNSLVKNHASNM